METTQNEGGAVGVTGRLHVRRFDTDEIVHTVEVENPHSTRMGTPKYEHVMMGLLRNMDTRRFYVDDSEIPAAP